LGGVGACLACEDGKLNDGPGLSTCTSCEPGTYPDGTGCIGCEPGTFAAFGASECAPCDNGFVATSSRAAFCEYCGPGKYADTALNTCKECVMGKYSLGGVTGECESCEHGKFNDGPGLSTCTTCEPGTFAQGTECVSCEPGFFAEFGATACSQCTEGFVSANSKSAFCEPCEAGKHSSAAADECVACAPGKVSSLGEGDCTNCEVGKFAPGSGNTGCTFCDDADVLKGSTTDDVGASSPSDCVCNKGEFADKGVCVAVFEGLNRTVDSMNVTTLNLETGYWRATASSKEILPCLSEDHCVGGVELSEICAEGHEGPLCAVCQEGYASTGSGSGLECEVCDGSATLTLVVGVVAFLAVIGLFAFRLYKTDGSRRRGVVDAATDAADAAEDVQERVGEKLAAVTDVIAKYQPLAKIMLSYFQIVSGLAFVYDIRFPKKFTKVISSISVVANIDFIPFLPIGCIATTDFHSSLVGYTLGPMLAFALMLGLYWSNKKSKPELANRVFR
jgi:hypothetical protein